MCSICVWVYPARKNDEPELIRWATFLAATTDEELRALAMKDPVLQQARDALERLSADPKARVLAEQRELALISYHLDMNKARKEGVAEGEARGRAEGLSAAILAVLSARQIAVSEEQRERISSCTDLALLDEWLARAATVIDSNEL